MNDLFEIESNDCYTALLVVKNVILAEANFSLLWWSATLDRVKNGKPGQRNRYEIDKLFRN